jgi:hypothetical protein
MNDRDIDELLREYADSPVPSLPGSFTQDVLREIRLRNADLDHGESWLSEVYALFLRPGLVAVTFSIAVAIGVAYPAMMSSPNSAIAVSSLGLDVFSHSTSHLPSELLAKAQ